MKTDPQDIALRRLLRQSWPSEEIPINPGFRAQVWARIDALERNPQTWAAWLKLHLLGVGMAAAASLAVAVAGSGLVAQKIAQRDREQLVGRYMASIDPHFRVGAASHDR